MSHRNIVFCVNARYAELVPTVIESILLNTKDELFTFYVIYSSITERAKLCIEKTAHAFNPLHNCVFIEFHAEEAFIDKATGKNYATAFRNSYDAFTRIFLTDILESYKVDKCLYLDVDLIANQPITPLLKILDETEYVCGATDLVFYEKNPDTKMLTYVNSGVLTLNLTNLRKFQFKDKCIAAIIQHTGENLFDQDIINLVLDGGYIKVIDQIFNEYRPKKALVEKAVIIHYTGPYKPWMLENRWRAKKFYWRMYHAANKLTLSGKDFSFEKLRARYQFLMKFRAFYNLALKVRLLFPVKNSQIVLAPGEKI